MTARAIRFDEATERLFRVTQGRQLQRTAGTTGGAFAILQTVLATLDVALLGAPPLLVLAPRLTAAAIGVGVWALGRTRLPPERWSTWVGVALALVGICHALLLATLRGVAAGVHEQALLLVMVLALAGLRLRFAHAMALGGLLCALYVGGLLFSGQPPYEVVVHATVAIGVAALSLVVALGRERLQRLHFRDVRELRHERHELARLSRELDRLASRDPLTGLGNRRELEGRMRAVLAATTRGGHPAVAAIVDLDRFKQVNDRLGHAAGDALLQRVARQLVDGLRACDEVFRIGGDEFCVLMPDTRLDAAIVALERLLGLLQGVAEGMSGIGFSAGCAESRPGEDGAALLHRADLELYRAKRSGRSRVSAAGPRLLPSAV